MILVLSDEWSATSLAELDDGPIEAWTLGKIILYVVLYAIGVSERGGTIFVEEFTRLRDVVAIPKLLTVGEGDYVSRRLYLGTASENSYYGGNELGGRNTSGE
jgi:hypothetical protein